MNRRKSKLILKLQCPKPKPAKLPNVGSKHYLPVHTFLHRHWSFAVEVRWSTHLVYVMNERGWGREGELYFEGKKRESEKCGFLSVIPPGSIRSLLLIFSNQKWHVHKEHCRVRMRSIWKDIGRGFSLFLYSETNDSNLVRLGRATLVYMFFSIYQKRKRLLKTTFWWKKSRPLVNKLDCAAIQWIF